MQKILVISASNNKEGNSASLAKYFLEKVDNRTYDIEWVYLYDLEIDPFTNENRKALIEQDPRNKDVRELITKIESTDTIIITTPIWNFSIPSVLKSMLDRTMASGRIWSEEKKKKVPGWKGKKFYLFFTMGAPFAGLPLVSLGMLQVFFTLKYFGASPKVIHWEHNCGNGSKNLVNDRNKMINKLHKKGKKFFS